METGIESKNPSDYQRRARIVSEELSPPCEPLRRAQRKHLVNELLPQTAIPTARFPPIPATKRTVFASNKITGSCSPKDLKIRPGRLGSRCDSAFLPQIPLVSSRWGSRLTTQDPAGRHRARSMWGSRLDFVSECYLFPRPVLGFERAGGSPGDSSNSVK